MWNITRARNTPLVVFHTFNRSPTANRNTSNESPRLFKIIYVHLIETKRAEMLSNSLHR